MKRIFVVLFAAIAMIGCSTQYQPEGFTGGFNDTQLSKDVFRISFTGNGYTSSDKVGDFVLLRAAELSMKNGYRYFAVIDGKETAAHSSYTTPTTYQTYGHVNNYGDTMSYSGTTYARGGQTFDATRHKNTIIIKCLVDDKQGGYSAEFISKNIKAKYKIK